MDLVTQIINRLEKTKTDLGETLAEGALQNFEIYQRVAGRREGVKLALEIINRILTESDDRASQI